MQLVLHQIESEQPVLPHTPAPATDVRPKRAAATGDNEPRARRTDLLPMAYLLFSTMEA